MLWAACFDSHDHLFFVFHSLPCSLGAQGKFSRGFVPKGPIWICHHSNFGFLLYFLSDRIIETNNKGGNVAHETIVNWLFFKSIFSTRPRYIFHRNFAFILHFMFNDVYSVDTYTMLSPFVCTLFIFEY